MEGLCSFREILFLKSLQILKMGKVGAAPTRVVAAQLEIVWNKMRKNLGKVGAAPTSVVAEQLEWCMLTHSRELAQGTTRDVPSRELAPNITTPFNSVNAHKRQLKI